MSVLLFLSQIYICFIIIRRKSLLIETMQERVWKAVIFSGGLLSVYTGIDKGESIYGLLRLGVYLIAGMAFQQIRDKDRQRILSSIPVLGVILSVCSLFHDRMLFRHWIALPSGRLAGPFEYPNTMALFLLLGVIIAEWLWKQGKRIIQFLLITGVIATGSRTVFVVLCFYLLYCFLRSHGKNKTFMILIALIGLIIYITVTCGQNLYGFGRFMKINIHSSTLQGRLLYWEDALRMLIKHPLGLGYMGYFYLQQTVQAGVYSVRFVHNEWLQWLLDYGMLAGIGLVLYFIRQFKLKKMGDMQKELLSIIAVCSFFDFHLQFTSIVCIVLILIPKGTVMCTGRQLLKWRWIIVFGTVAATGLFVADTMAQYFAAQGNYQYAIKCNPLSAQYKQEYLLQSEDLRSAAEYADKLLRDNQYLYTAYLIKSNAAAQEGRVDLFIENRRQVLKLRKYKVKEYEDYFQILLSWYIKSYTEKNDEVMIQCKRAMKEIPKMIMTVKKQTSVRAYRIQQKPDLNFNKEYEKIIVNL